MMRKMSIVGRIDHKKTALTAMIVHLLHSKHNEDNTMTVSKTPQTTDTRLIIIGAANRAGVAEAAADRVADQLLEEGFKVVKMTTEEKETEMQKNQLRVQPQKDANTTNDATKTSADAAVKEDTAANIAKSLNLKKT